MLRAMIAALWIVTGLGLLAWSFAAWGLWWLLGRSPAWWEASRAWIENLPGAEWLDAWMPGWSHWLNAAIALTQGLVGPVLDWLPWVIGALWALGCLLTLLFSGLLHWAIHESRPQAAVPLAGPA